MIKSRASLFGKNEVKKVSRKPEKGKKKKNNKSKRKVTKMQSNSSDHLFFSDEHLLSGELRIGLGFGVSGWGGDWWLPGLEGWPRGGCRTGGGGGVWAERRAAAAPPATVVEEAGWARSVGWGRWCHSG